MGEAANGNHSNSIDIIFISLIKNSEVLFLFLVFLCRWIFLKCKLSQLNSQLRTLPHVINKETNDFRETKLVETYVLLIIFLIFIINL